MWVLDGVWHAYTEASGDGNDEEGEGERFVRRRMKYALIVWIAQVVVLWCAYAPWRAGAVDQFVLQSDAREYYAASVNLLSNGVYSTASATPRDPDNYRPPLFPLVTLALYRVFGIKPLLALMLNGALFLLCIMLVSRLTRQLGGDEASARWAVWVAVVCPLWIVTSLMYMPDALFTFVMAVFYLFWLGMPEEVSVGRSAAAGSVLGMATLAKPVTLYMPVLLVPLLLWYGMRQRKVWKALWCVAVFVGVYVSVLAPWCVRNYHVYGRFSFVSYEGQSLLDFTAASVIRRRFRCDLITARSVLHRRLAERYDVSGLDDKARATLPVLVETNVTWAGEAVAERYWPQVAERRVVRNLADLSAAEKELFVAVFKSHPITYALDTVRGVANILFLPPWQECLRMTMPGVDAMRLAISFLRGDVETLQAVGWGKVIIAVTLAGWMTAVAIGVVLGAAAGLARLFHERHVVSAVTCVVLVGYFLVIAGPNGEARYRAPLLPLMFALAGMGWHVISDFVRRRLRLSN